MVTLLRDAFRRSLKNYPLATNMAVYFGFYTAADVSQQAYKRMQSNTNVEKPEYNLQNTAKLAAVGTTVYAPALYYCYRWLDKKFPAKNMKSVLIKVCADQGFMTPTLLFTFFIVMAVVEGRQDLFEEIREKYWKTYMANQSFWIPAQTVNFYLLPANYRVIYVATMSFLWINVLCYIKRQKLKSEM